MNYLDDPAPLIHLYINDYGILWMFLLTYLLTAVAHDFMNKLIADCYTGVASDADTVCVLQ